MPDDGGNVDDFNPLVSRGLLEYRLLVQEKRGDDQELRLRVIEGKLLTIAGDIKSVNDDTTEIKTSLNDNAKLAREAVDRTRAANRNNLVSLGIAALSIIGTVLLTHFVH